MPHAFSTGSPDKEFNCYDKLNETGSLDKESSLAQTSPDGSREKSDSLRDLGTTFDSDKPPRSTTTSSDWRGRGMYNVIYSILENCEMYGCICKVSFYFIGSLYEISVLMTLVLQIEVSLYISWLVATLVKYK